MGRGLRLRNKADVDAMLGRDKKKSPKYKNKKVVYDGIKFDSLRERDRYKELKLLEAAGAIRDLVLQKRYYLEIGGIKICYVDTGRQIYYTPDFTYFDVEMGRERIEDAKGYPTRDYRIRRALMVAMGLHVEET